MAQASQRGQRAKLGTRHLSPGPLQYCPTVTSADTEGIDWLVQAKRP